MEMIDFERNAMQVNKTNQMVFLKNVESNIIKDAWIMLRENVSYKENNKETFDEIDVLREAENLINNNIESEQVSLLKFNLKRLKHKYKWVKRLNIFLVIMIIIYRLIN